MGLKNKVLVLHLQGDRQSQRNRKIATGFMSHRNVFEYRKRRACKEAIHKMREGFFGRRIILHFHARKEEIAGFVILHGNRKIA